MTIIARPIRKFAEEEAERLGLQVSWSNGSKHPIMVVTKGDTSRSIAVAKSPRSKNNQFDWIRQDLRRLSKEINAQLS